MNVDFLVTFVMWLLVATTKIHFETCFCAVSQDLRPRFFQDFFSTYPIGKTHFVTTLQTLTTECLSSVCI